MMMFFYIVIKNVILQAYLPKQSLLFMYTLYPAKLIYLNFQPHI